MDKPISLKMREFKNNAVNLVNTSGLPLFIIEPILKEVMCAVESKAEQEYQIEKATYERSLKEQEGENQND